jgi:hypothetical protein
MKARGWGNERKQSATGGANGSPLKRTRNIFVGDQSVVAESRHARSATASTLVI